MSQQKIAQETYYFPTVTEFEPQIVLEEGRFDSPGLETRLHAASDEFFFTDRFISQTLQGSGRLDGSDTVLIDELTFTENEHYAEGRKDSRQEVYFGDVVLRASGVDVELPVACKPYGPGARRYGVHEFAGMEVGHKDEYLKTYEPIGFWVDEQGQATLLSHFEERVQSLDNINWDITEEDKIKEIFDPMFALEAAARTLGNLHSRGFVHRDAGAKNMAVEYDEAGEPLRLRLIDIPQMIQVIEDEEWHRWVRDDLRTFTGTVLDSGFLDTTDTRRVHAILDRHFFSLHKSVLLHPSSVIEIDNQELEQLDAMYKDLN